MRTSRPLVLALLLVLLLPALALAAPQRHRLANGMTVLISENHEAPVAAFQVWVRAGSAFEGPGEYGITHLIEHMIFKGTPSLPAGQMARRIEALGGEVNAYTTLDHTNYYLAASSQRAGQALALLADAVVNASFDPAELAAEKEVVIEEIRMGLDDPHRRRSQALMALAFGDHPYGRPVIGTEESVRAITRAHIQAFRQRWYRAPNMVLVAVGDFDPAVILAQAEKAFASLSPDPAPEFHAPPAAQGPGPQIKVLREKVRQAAISLAWRVPGLPSPEVLPLDVAAFLAGEGKTSRLYAELKERRGLLDAVDAANYTPEGLGLFEVEAQMAPDKVAQTWEALLEESMSLLSRPASGAELKRSRVGLEAEFVRGRMTMAGQARMLGYFEMFRGGFEKAQDFMRQYKAVDAAQILEAARRHLRPENLSLVAQIPEGASAPDLTQLQAKLDQIMARLEPAGPVQAPQAHKFNLENGLTLIVKPQQAVPLAAMVLAGPGGQAAETEQEAGLSQIWAQTLTRGSSQHSYESLAQELEGMAAGLEGFSSRSTAGLSGSFLSENWRRGLELMAEVWNSPSFPPEQIERAKATQLAKLRAQEDSPVARGFKRFRKLLYGEHVYGRDPLGSPAGLAALGRDQLLALHGRLRGPGGLVLTVVGDVEAEEVARQVNRLFGGLQGRVEAANLPLAAALDAPRQDQIKDAKAQQTQIMLGFIAPAADDPARWPFRVMEAILGGQGGRLFVELRDKRSLAYGVQPFYTPSRRAGAFGVYMGVGPGKEAKALAGLAQQLKRLRQEEPSPEEMERAVGYLLGQEAIGLQSYGAKAMTMAQDELLGLGYDEHQRTAQHLQAVTPALVRQQAAQVLDPQRQALLTLGP